MTKPLLLASSSPYRKALLERLGLPFETASPNVDETPEPHETAHDLAVRLASAKAQALAPAHPGHWIIGSDQVACLPDGTLLHKPGSHDQARQQLELSSGHCVLFITGLCLLDADSGRCQSTSEPYRVHFRQLSGAEIKAYLEREQPFNCAGSFKMEGLGITLFERLDGRDPNSLIGLPLIALNQMLIRWGRNPLLASS